MAARRGEGRAGPRWTYDLSTPVRREAADVFDFLADVQEVESLPRRPRVRMTKTPDRPTTVGTRWLEQVRMAPGLWLHIESRVTECDRPRRLGMDFRSPFFHGHLVYDITLEGERRARLRQREWLVPHRALRLLGPRAARSLDRRLHTRLDDIRAVLEGDVGRGGVTVDRAAGPGRFRRA